MLFLAMLAAVIVPVMSVVVKDFELGLFTAKPIAIYSESRDLSSTISYAIPVVSSGLESRIQDTKGAMDLGAMDLELVESSLRNINIPWRIILLFCWMIATLILLVRLIIAFVNGFRLIRGSQPQASKHINQAAGIAKEKLGVTKNLEICSSKQISSPMIWCWSKEPVLLIPNDLNGKVDWVGVISHELAHWKRWDHISGLMSEIIVCILSWNPLLWWSKKRLVRLSEQACDDWVVSNGQPVENYTRSLLNFTPQKQAAFVPAVIQSRKGVAARVHRILNDACSNPRTGLIWAVLVSVVVACAAVGCAFMQTRPVESEKAPKIDEKPSKSFYQAAADGDIEQVKLNLSQGAEINSTDNRNRTALHLAAQGGHSDVIKLLIERGADINVKGKAQRTPLHTAAINGDKKTVELLLGKGSDIEAKDRFGITPLFTAMTSTSDGRREIVDFLVAKGAKVPDFHFAAYMGDMEKIKKYLQDGLDINSQENFGSAALHLAANTGRKEIVEFLISKGAKVDAKDVYEWTALGYAAMHNDGNIMDFLIEKGADVIAKDDQGYTLLYYTIWENKKEPVELLIDKGAKVNIKATDGYSPLVYAIWMDNKELVEALINKGADVNAEDNEGYTPFYWATVQESKDIVELLTAKGAIVVDTIHTAAATGDLAKIESLVKEGTDIDAKDKNGRTLMALSCIFRF